MAGEWRREIPALSEDDEHFYRVMHYTASAAWLLGVADEARTALSELVSRALRDRDEGRAALQPQDSSPRFIHRPGG
jgi:hypothetical protein